MQRQDVWILRKKAEETVASEGRLRLPSQRSEMSNETNVLHQHDPRNPERIAANRVRYEGILRDHAEGSLLSVRVAFLNEMEGKEYGASALLNAFGWFQEGWNRRLAVDAGRDACEELVTAIECEAADYLNRGFTDDHYVVAVRKEIAIRMRAALSRPAPEAGVRVPVEPTDEMLDAARAFADESSYLAHPKVRPWRGTDNGDTHEAWERDYYKAMWQAMLSAAQSAKPARGL